MNPLCLQKFEKNHENRNEMQQAIIYYTSLISYKIAERLKLSKKKD